MKDVIYVMILLLLVVGFSYLYHVKDVVKVDISIETYEDQRDSISKIVNTYQRQIDSLTDVKSKIVTKYETLYNYMLVADNDSVVSYISKKIYCRE